MISNERLEEISENGDPWLDEAQDIARELLALRKAFSEPVGYVHQIYNEMETGVISKDNEAYEDSPNHFPLYRKPPTE